MQVLAALANRAAASGQAGAFDERVASAVEAIVRDGNLELLVALADALEAPGREPGPRSKAALAAVRPGPPGSPAR